LTSRDKTLTLAAADFRCSPFHRPKKCLAYEDTAGSK
jgi:hypothetical protein